MSALSRLLTACSVVLVLAFVARPDSNSQTRQFPVKQGEVYGLTLSIAAPERFAKGEIEVEVRDANGLITSKILHPFDLDFSVNLRPRASGSLTVSLTAKDVLLDQVGAGTELVPLHISGRESAGRESAGRESAGRESVVVAALPNSTWQEAQPVELGQTVFGSADERPYVPSSPETNYPDMMKGFQWLQFTVPGKEARLAHFALETPDRDVPPDIDVFEPAPDGGIVAYKEGASAYTPEATQNYPGLFPFRTRVLHPGKTYYLRVAANHPEYRLRTTLYPVPAYKEPQQAVVAGMDYLIALGDAWHANAPRRGSIALRNSMAHPEAQACIACHPTQFTVRGYLTAVENGYPVHRQAALRFLTERLANNPRPLYGHDQTDWARVIFSARTVSSRVPVLLDMTERLTPEVFDTKDITRGFANYLNLHYGSRKELPDDEADGASPMVSAFEIGLQSWQTYGLMARDDVNDPQWAARQNEVRDMILARAPANTIDLCWKIAALSTIDRDGYRTATGKLIEQLYSWQNEKGQFPYQFERGSAPADFITYHAMYALALAGHRPESDPRLARMVAYALQAQRSDGSWQGDPNYKGFDTPFRDTQFAVMGLSQLYRYRGDSAAAAPVSPATAPTRLRTASLDELLSDIDAAPAHPTDDLRTQMRSVATGSPWPLARSAAASYLGTTHDTDSLPALAQALGDSSKIVQRSAAEAYRRIALSHPEMVAPSLAAALNSSNGRTRWGALRVFGQEFRSLTDDATLLASVEKAASSDALPQNRFQAANALWRWYAWQTAVPQRRTSILEALAKPLGTETDRSVRRGLSESLYNVLDENAGELEAWERAMASEADAKATDAAYHRVVAEQSELLAGLLESGNRKLRMGVLTSLWDFHLRHMAIPEDNKEKVDVALPAFFADYSAGVTRLHEADFTYEPYAETARFEYRATNDIHITRLGNDTDVPQLFPDTSPRLEKALLKCLEGADKEMTLQVIKAGSILGAAETPAFTISMLRLLESPDKDLRAAVRYVYEKNERGHLNLGDPEKPDPVLLKALPELLARRNPDVLAVALPLISTLPIDCPMTRDRVLEDSVESILRLDEVPAFASVLRASAAFPNIADMPVMRTQMLAALTGSDYDAQQAAIELVLSRYISDPLSELSRQFINVMQGRERAMLLDKMDPAKFALRIPNPYGIRTELPVDDNIFSSALVIRTIVDGLASREKIVHEAAVDLVHQQVKLQENAEIKEAMPANPQRSAPDFEYFVAKVEPILAAPGGDGKACVVCHASHAIFKLRVPASPGHFTAQQSAENYRSALKVIDSAEPRRSLLLVKPTRPNDTVGDANQYRATHNGGQRWAGDETSPEYQTIIEWIRGANLADAASRESARAQPR